MHATLVPFLRRHGRRSLILFLLAGLAAALVLRLGGAVDAAPRYGVPHDGQMEAALGIRFTQAAIVADGGLIELRYVVLNAEKASAFQNDTKHPPQLRNEHNGRQLWRAVLMKQGHELRPGQSYYLLYMNTKGTVKRGDKIEIGLGGHRLQHVPVR